MEALKDPQQRRRNSTWQPTVSSDELLELGEVRFLLSLSSSHFELR
jgi:hypothetical protein